MMHANPKIEMAPLAALRPYANNARRHSRSRAKALTLQTAYVDPANPDLHIAE